jgi:hypothetical protein
VAAFRYLLCLNALVRIRTESGDEPMNKPLHNIKDDKQLDYVIEAIDEIDYELSLFQYKLAYIFDDVEDADSALMHLRLLIANFVRTGLGVIDGSEGEDDDAANC